MAKDPKFYADHLLEAVTNIEADIKNLDCESFHADRRARQLVERNLEIISESSRRLPEHLKTKEKGIEWSAIAGIGNILRHDYHESDPTTLWETCEKDIPTLKAAATRILRAIERVDRPRITGD